MNASREQPFYVRSPFVWPGAICRPSGLNEYPPLSLSLRPSLQLPLRLLPSLSASRYRWKCHGQMAGMLVCPSCSQKAAGIPWNVAANATLCLSPVQVSWIGHSRDRSLPPGRRARSRRMPNMAWERLLSLHFVRCPLLPASLLRRHGTYCPSRYVAYLAPALRLDSFISATPCCCSRYYS